MRVWLITIGEPLPIDGDCPRLFRTGILSRMLESRGHDVVWWTSCFDHFSKTQRFEKDTDLPLTPRLRLRLLRSPGYRRNVSVRRLFDHRVLGRRFARLAEAESRPDVILCSLPTLELADVAVDYGRRKGVPVIVDVRDMWPDIFVDLAPRWGRAVARAVAGPMFRMARRACRGATAITAMAPAFVDWGVGLAGRARGPLDRDFAHAYAAEPPDSTALAAAARYWQDLGLTGDGTQFVACFIGTIGHQFDFATVIRAAQRLGTRRDFRLVLCGDGPRADLYRRMAAACENILFPGWLGAAEIWALMRRSSVGLAPYHARPDFLVTLSNKVIEYLSAGLPVVSSLRDSYIEQLLGARECGMFYRAGSDEELEHLLVGLMTDRCGLARMSANARALYEQSFSAERVYGDMSEYLEGIAARARPGCAPSS